MKRITLREFIEKALELDDRPCSTNNCTGTIVLLWIGDDDDFETMSIHCNECQQEYCLGVALCPDEEGNIFTDWR